MRSRPAPSPDSGAAAWLDAVHDLQRAQLLAAQAIAGFWLDLPRLWLFAAGEAMLDTLERRAPAPLPHQRSAALSIALASDLQAASRDAAAALGRLGAALEACDRRSANAPAACGQGAAPTASPAPRVPVEAVGRLH
ncbi:MAG: hypothetical protein KDG55_01600 [Rhodocyclaceae bacterium]|nr:hypothetical protein [Rhodocyclaceae bacterium]